MKRTMVVMLLLTLQVGCVALEQQGGFAGGGCQGHCGVGAPPTVPGMQGPWGQPVAMAPPYTSAPPTAAAARHMVAQSVPLEYVQMAGAPGMASASNGAFPPSPSGIMQAGGPLMPGLPSGIMQASANMAPGAGSGIVPAGGPPAGALAGVLPGAITPPGVPVIPGLSPAGAVAAVGALTACTPNKYPNRRTSVRFLSPAGMKITWYAPTADGRHGFASVPLDVPGRYNFIQAAIYRLKLSDIPNRPGLELYPTLEVVPSNCKTDPFLAHSSVPVSFTDEDFDQVAAGNYVVKVIYLPDPQFQDLATTGPDEVVSSRLEPGVDPLAEAHRRGSILLVVRIGNIDLEAPNTPAMDAPCAYQPKLPPQLPMDTASSMPGSPMGPGMMGQGRVVMGPNGPMMMGPNGPMMMGPNGPMMMGPNGPMMMGPNGPMMGPSGPMPGGALPVGPVAGQPPLPAMLPPSAPSAPAISPPGPPPAAMPSTPAAKLPEAPEMLPVKHEVVKPVAKRPIVTRSGARTPAALTSQEAAAAIAGKKSSDSLPTAAPKPTTVDDQPTEPVTAPAAKKPAKSFRWWSSK